MLVFVDEAGDPWFKFEKNSSLFFTIGLVVFEDRDEAIACENRIELLKRELWYSSSFEFHFKSNSKRVRESFFSAVAPYNFFYYGIVINKSFLYSENLQVKDSFYKYVSSLVFENAKEKLVWATVVVDKSWSKNFERQLQTYLKRKFNGDDIQRIKKLKMQDSSKNNLLQLVDYVTSGIHVSYSSPHKDIYMHKLRHREMYVQIWPKEKPTPSQ